MALPALPSVRPRKPRPWRDIAILACPPPPALPTRADFSAWLILRLRVGQRPRLSSPHDVFAVGCCNATVTSFTTTTLTIITPLLMIPQVGYCHSYFMVNSKMQYNEKAVVRSHTSRNQIVRLCITMFSNNTDLPQTHVLFACSRPFKIMHFIVDCVDFRSRL